MNDNYTTIQQSSDFEPHEKYYWGYQYLLSRDFIVPELTKRGVFKAGDSVAEIGCGEAGVLDAFVEAGATNAIGTDIVPYRLQLGKKIAERLHLPMDLSEHDILFSQPPAEWRNAYNLVILRDVIEHLDDAALALKNIRSIMKPGAWLYVTFPPYNSPYGGHQQLLENSWGKIPYVHLLPKSLFAPMVNAGKQKANVEEVHRLSNIRLSAKKFVKAAKDAGYVVRHEDYYLLRPVFKMKFGLPAIKITALKSLPLIKSAFSLEASYLLQVQNP